MITALDPRTSSGKHWLAHGLLAVLLIIALVTSGFGLGALFEAKALSGATAAKPGLQLIPGTKPTTPTNMGLGGASSITGLFANEGSGSSWCSSHGGRVLGAHFKDVYACAPATGVSDVFDTVGYQCVELSVRFAWAVYGKYFADIPSGRSVVQIVHAETGIPVGYPGAKSLPQPGDVLSMSGGPSSDVYGHTAVAVADHVNANGNGTITTMEENGSSSGWDSIRVRGWHEAFGDPNYLGGLYYYNNISWLKLAKVVASKFPVNMWDHFKKSIPYQYNGKILFQATYWLSHRGLGAPISKVVYHLNHRIKYKSITFKTLKKPYVKHNLYWWPTHPTWTPHVKRTT